MRFPDGWVITCEVDRLEVTLVRHELVMCRHCKEWYQDADTGMSCRLTGMAQPLDGFCNWAKERSDDD